MSNFNLRCISLLIAICLWYFVTTNISTITLSVPIELINTPRNKVLLSEFPDHAQVKVSGPSFLVSSLGASPPRFQIKVPENVSARFVIPLHSEPLALPSAVTVLSVEPEEVSLSFDERAVKTVPVEVPKLGLVPDGLTIEKLQISPSQVAVSGGASEVRQVNRVETYPLDLRELTRDADLSFSLRKPPGKLSLSEDTVRLHIEVSPVQAKRRWPSLSIEIRSVDGERYDLTPRSVSLEVSGAREPVGALKAEEIIPYVRIGRGTTPGAELSVSVDLPKGIELVSMEPKTVKVFSVDAGAKPATSKTPVKKGK